MRLSQARVQTPESQTLTRRAFLKFAVLASGLLLARRAGAGDDALAEFFGSEEKARDVVESRRKLHLHNRLSEIQGELDRLGKEHPLTRDGLREAIAGIEQAKKVLEQDARVRDELAARAAVKAALKPSGSYIAAAVGLAAAVALWLSVRSAGLRRRREDAGRPARQEPGQKL
ncbi:MAG: hypothetical protein QXH27_05960 [Candidatus Micrarchaeia archaeon]